MCLRRAHIQVPLSNKLRDIDCNRLLFAGVMHDIMSPIAHSQNSKQTALFFFSKLALTACSFFLNSCSLSLSFFFTQYKYQTGPIKAAGTPLKIYKGCSTHRSWSCILKIIRILLTSFTSSAYYCSCYF